MLRHEQIDFSGLMANVSQLSTSSSVSYPADIVLERDGNVWNLRYGGKTAQAVDTIEGFILVDPTQVQAVHALSPSFRVFPEQGGMYRFEASVEGKNITPGTLLSTLHIEGSAGSHISLTDTSFTSGETRYLLSNIVE